MMVKLYEISCSFLSLFESSVNLYDGQTEMQGLTVPYTFESSVNLYDGQTLYVHDNTIFWFESSVNLYDGQTSCSNVSCNMCV